MAEPEVTNSDLSEKLDTLSSAVSDDLDALSSDLSQKIDTSTTGVFDKLDVLSNDLSQKLDGVNNGLDNVRAAVDSVDANSVDYSTTLEQVGQLLAVTDILLVILCVMVFLACGLFCGYQVTKWMRADA